MDVTRNALVALYFATIPPHDYPGPDANDGEVWVFHIPKQNQHYFDSEQVSCVSNLANLSSGEKEEIAQNYGNGDALQRTSAVKKLLRFVRMEHPGFDDPIGSSQLFGDHYVIPKLENRRMVAQSGSFIIYGLQNPGSIQLKHCYVTMRSITILGERKFYVHKELEQLGFTEGALFPELDRAAKDIARRWA